MASPSDPPVPPPPPRRGHPLLAWLVLLAVVGFVLWRAQTTPPEEKEEYGRLTLRLQGRYLVGVTHLLPLGQAGKDRMYEEARALDRGPFAERLRFVALAGELKGPAEARARLRAINARYRERHGEPPAEDARAADALDRAYALREKEPPALAELPEDDRRRLRESLGWFGELALTPEGGDEAARRAVLAPAYRTAGAVLGAGLVLLGVGGVGLVVLVTLTVLYFLGRLPGGLSPGSGAGGVYAETFALYMLLFLGLSVAGRFVVTRFGLEQRVLALSGVAALGSLAALGWPVLRGVPWRQVRHDIGWVAGARPWREVLLGFCTYAMALPLTAVAVLVVVLTTRLREVLQGAADEFAPVDVPGHPIALQVSGAAWWVWLEILFLAAVVAPLVEETMFRGVLYRHLREAGRRLPPALGVLGSALLTSFVFAVIHPQGLMGVPVLMALAVAFSLAREWRGTLIPAMVAHSLNNSVATLVLFLTMS